MPVPYRPDNIELPDLYNSEEVASFITALDTQLSRFGVKKLRKEAQNTYARLKHIQRSEKEMKRLLRVVNGQPTDAQHQYYEEKKVRTAAQRFYDTLSTPALEVHCQIQGIRYTPGVTDRESMIIMLVKGHLDLESGRRESVAWGEAAQQAEQSGYIGPEETERVLQSGAE